MIVLVVFLGAPEGRGLGDDLGTEVTPIEGIFFLHLLHHLLDLFGFVCIVAEDHRSILTADIGTLLIGGSRIVQGKEQLNQIAVSELPWIVEQFHHLGMTGLPGADLLVGGIVVVTSHVAGDGIDDAIEARKAILHAPESAATEPGASQFRVRVPIIQFGNLARNRLALRIEMQGCRVEAVAGSGRGRPVGEGVTEMGITAATGDLDAHHAMALIVLLANVLRVEGVEEGGPPGTGIELVFGAKQRQVTDNTGVYPVRFLRQIAAAERSFRC